MTNDPGNKGRWFPIAVIGLLLLIVSGLGWWAYDLSDHSEPAPIADVADDCGPAIAVEPSFCTVSRADAKFGVQGVGDRGEQEDVRLAKCSLPPKMATELGFAKTLCQVEYGTLVPLLCLLDDDCEIADADKAPTIAATKETVELKKPTVTPAATEVATAP